MRDAARKPSIGLNSEARRGAHPPPVVFIAARDFSISLGMRQIMQRRIEQPDRDRSPS